MYKRLTKDVDESRSRIPCIEFGTVLFLGEVDALHSSDWDKSKPVEQESSRLQEWLECFLNLLEAVLRPVHLEHV
jgi:hypothetical protein